MGQCNHKIANDDDCYGIEDNNIQNIYNLDNRIVIYTNLSGKINYVNDKIQILFYDKKDLLGKNIYTIIDKKYYTSMNDIYKGDLEHVLYRGEIYDKHKKTNWFDINLIKRKDGVIIFCTNVNTEIQLSKILDEMRNENRHIRSNILQKIFPEYILHHIETGNTDFLINHQNIIIGAFDIVNYTESCVINATSFSVLKPLYSEADRLCKIHNICLIEIIGDSMIVAGNCTQRHINTVENVIDFMNDFITFCTKTTNLDIRCGIAVGRAMSGMIGCNQLRYHIFGTAMNLATRMENLATYNTIRMTDRARESILKENEEKYNIIKETKEVKGFGLMDTYTLKENLVINKHIHLHKKSNSSPNLRLRTIVVNEDIYVKTCYNSRNQESDMTKL